MGMHNVSTATSVCPTGQVRVHEQGVVFFCITEQTKNQAFNFPITSVKPKIVKSLMRAGKLEMKS